MAKAFKELKLIKERFIEEIDELIAQYKEEKTSTDDVHFDDLEEELGQILSDILDESEGDWKISF
jgi:hypothetical protein